MSERAVPLNPALKEQRNEASQLVRDLQKHLDQLRLLEADGFAQLVNELQAIIHEIQSALGEGNRA